MAADGSIDPTLAARRRGVKGEPAETEAIRLRSDLRESQEALRLAEQQFACTAADLMEARARLATIQDSRSWRLIERLRQVTTWLGRTPNQPPASTRPRMRAAGRANTGAELVAVAPQVSVIAMPVGPAGVWPALEALRQLPAGRPFEVLLPMPEDRAEGAPPPQAPGLCRLHMPPALSPAAMCNAAAAAAKGDYIVIWDSVSIPQPGWLAALADCFACLDDVGMAGAVLLDAQRRILAAGATIAADGRLMPLGKG